MVRLARRSVPPILLAVSGVLLVMSVLEIHEQASVLPTPPPSQITDPLGWEIAAPVRLRVPRIHIDAPVDPVGRNALGNMEVPISEKRAGWYAPGTRPGNPGNAALSGHLDTAKGTLGVFWRLHELAEGDDVYVDTASGRTLHFRVTANSVFDWKNAPLPEIFGKSPEHHLQLITCNGVWLKQERSYDKRLVIFTTQVTDDETIVKKE